MIKLFFILVFLITNTFASDVELATKIYLSIAKKLSHKKVPKFHLLNKVEYLSDNSKINNVDNCEDADVLVMHKPIQIPESCKNKLIMTDKYRTYTTEKNIIAAFYWKRGRPSIIFRKELLQKHNIVFNSTFKKYVK